MFSIFYSIFYTNGKKFQFDLASDSTALMQAITTGGAKAAYCSRVIKISA